MGKPMLSDIKDHDEQILKDWIAYQFDGNSTKP